MISGMMNTTSSLSRTSVLRERNSRPTYLMSFRYGTPVKSPTSCRWRSPPITTVCRLATVSMVEAELVSMIGWLSPGVKPVSRLNSGFDFHANDAIGRNLWLHVQRDARFL